ncbi:unnamed protein product [Ectocarpus sp. CCAP 1310/34]|nr:unnamed protein product [Ectocarpus sp. CCAP 1310/34]
MYLLRCITISNIGFFDINDKHVEKAVSQDTLFIHGNTLSGGSVASLPVKHAHRPRHSSSNCTDACGSRTSAGNSAGISTICDESCSVKWSSTGPRFGGHNCGAGNASQYGSNCRLCYTNSEEASTAESMLALSSVDTLASDAHVVMCGTRNPPSGPSCSAGCENTIDTVCDYRCGSGLYGDLHCNWRGLGKTCRLCFHDDSAAYLADEAVKAQGGRVILCNTLEPPRSIGSEAEARRNNSGGGRLASSIPENDDPIGWQTNGTISDPVPTVLSSSMGGQMCAFMRGYFEFLSETIISVRSVLDFMPAMRVAIVTHPRDFHVFNRSESFALSMRLTLAPSRIGPPNEFPKQSVEFGHLQHVSIGNSSSVEYGSLMADQLCGNGTRLIYYMEVGQVLSRTFTLKGTHTARQELIVSFADARDVHPENVRRAMGSTVLLGFPAPTFTHGSDLILPAETNGQLRALLGTKTRQGRRLEAGLHGAELDVEDLYAYLASVADLHRESTSIYVPEVLAALAYLQMPGEVHFVNIRAWSRENLFSVPSIWDIPMVKPRFGCSFDTALSLMGYRMDDFIANELEAFKWGAKCELGFKSVKASDLEVKVDWEFGAEGANVPVRKLAGCNISVMYRTFSGDARLFNMSIATVIERFPSALEVVAVVVEADVALFEGIVKPLRATAPFPIRVVAEPQLMDGNIQQKYSKLRADLYTKGDYILHMDSDVVMFEDLTYRHIFHLRKPVLPFRRYRNETGVEGLTTIMCWQNGTSFAIGEDVVHEFSIFNTHVYPRSMYPAARTFIEQHHGMAFVDFMSTRRGSCLHPNNMAKLTMDERRLMFSDFNYMGAYLWYHMHDAVYWLAADPYDTRPDDWRPDIIQYAWVCQANGRHVPSDAEGLNQYLGDYRMVKTITQCEIVKAHWKKGSMKSPATRPKIDTDSKEWAASASSDITPNA